MLVKQISVFAENKSGRIAEITEILADCNIDICALCVADTNDFGILRLIVNDPAMAEKALKDRGLTVSSTDVIAISVNDRPGGLSKVLTILENNGINIEYLYAFVGRVENRALVVLRVENTDIALKILKDNDVSVLSAKQVYDL